LEKTVAWYLAEGKNWIAERRLPPEVQDTHFDWLQTEVVFT
jgi:hypothetical protein